VVIMLVTAPMFEDGVGADRLAVPHVVDRAVRQALVLAEFDDAGDDAARRVVGPGRNLVD
jgi:hypothetical protein